MLAITDKAKPCGFDSECLLGIVVWYRRGTALAGRRYAIMRQCRRQHVALLIGWCSHSDLLEFFVGEALRER